MSLEKERVEALQRVIDELRDEPGALMPIMQRAQDIFGYLPEDVQKYIAKEMDIPVSDLIKASHPEPQTPEEDTEVKSIF